jgi:hypothetical protein
MLYGWETRYDLIKWLDALSSTVRSLFILHVV